MAVNNNNKANEVNFVKVESDKVAYLDDAIESTYEYTSTLATRQADGRVTLKPETTTYRFNTKTTLPKLGCMLVGLGGNNGSTVVAGALANKKNMSWMTKSGQKTANYYGSITQCSTLPVGRDAHGAEVFVGFNEIVPMVSPSDIVWSGWDISKMNLADAMERAKVLDYDLQRQLRPDMEKIVPLPSIFNVDFVAGNQEARADNVKTGTIEEQMNEVRADIRRFKADNALDKVIVLWTANTERFAAKVDGVNDTADNLLAAIKRGESEVSPSTLFAVACILEGVCFINGSPQNTFVPGCIELALRHNVPIGGDDFKSGQTKFKSVLVDFLVNAGIKPRSIMSYNHLGNNDGLNLSVQKTFRSKEVSKSNVVDDMVASNHRLYEKDEHPDHTIVIKYCPFVADSKRAMDEYTSEIFLGGHNTLVVHNTCEDSLLATPIIYDLVILAELTQRITYRVGESAAYENFHPVLSLLSYLCKAPLVPDGRPVINALFKQRAAIDNLLRACVGLPAENNMRLEDVRFTGVSAEAKAAAQADLTKTVPSVVKVGGAAPTIA